MSEFEIRYDLHVDDVLLAQTRIFLFSIYYSKYRIVAEDG
jgi:hypothetical protein